MEDHTTADSAKNIRKKPDLEFDIKISQDQLIG